MTDEELFRLYLNAGGGIAGRRALFNAGVESVLECDEISEEEIAELLIEENRG